MKRYGWIPEYFRGTFTLLGLTAVILTFSQCDRGPKADLLLTNAKVITMADGSSGAVNDVVAIKDGLILDIGPAETILKKKYQNNKTVVKDLEGKTLLPGFISSHMHFFFFALAAEWPDVSSINTFFNPSPPWQPTRKSSEIMAKVRDLAAQEKDPEQWIKVFAFDPSRQVEDVAVDRESLDQVSPQNPVFIMNNSMHFAYVNTPALKKLNICGSLAEQDPKTCFDAKISPSEQENAKQGVLQEGAMLRALLFLLPTDPEESFKIAKRGAKMLAGKGYTTISEGGANLELLKFYQKLTAQDDFPLNAVVLPVFTMLLDNSPNGLSGYLKANQHSFSPTFKVGPVKFWADGSVQGYSSFMLQPYKTRPPWADPNQIYRGSPNVPEEMKLGFKKAVDEGYQIAVHVNGDASLEMVLDLWDENLKTKPNSDNRFQLIHVPFAVSDPNLGQLQRIQKGGYVATFLAGNNYYWGKVVCEEVMGAARAKNFFPVKDAMKMGVPISLHSDAPVNVPDPLFTIWTAVTRKVQPWGSDTFTAQCPEVQGPNQRISILDGLKAYTRNAAYQFFMDQTHGTIEKGKVADLVVLSDNPLNYEANPDGLLNIQTVATVHRGRYLPVTAGRDFIPESKPAEANPEGNH